MTVLLENTIEKVMTEEVNMKVTFNTEGVMLDNTFITFADNAYDDFVFTLQRHGLRNLVEYAERFTVTHKPLVDELRELHGTHAGMTIVEYAVALELFKNGTEIYNLYDDGSDGLVEEIESMHQHNEYGGEFGHE